MRNKTSLKFSAAVILTSAMVLTGCGEPGADDTETGAQPSPPESTVTETVTDEPPQETASIPDNSDDDSAPGEEPGPGFPTNAVDYADALVIAWGEGDEPAMQDLAQPEVLEVLEEYGIPGGSHWEQTDSDSGAGSTFVTYENSEDATIVELRVRNEDASSGEPNAVVEAKFTE